jgi:hypothetical protein
VATRWGVAGSATALLTSAWAGTAVTPCQQMGRRMTWEKHGERMCLSVTMWHGKLYSWRPHPLQTAVNSAVTTLPVLCAVCCAVPVRTPQTSDVNNKY